MKVGTGFTLIEMTVVLAILGLVVGVVITRQPWRSSRLDAEATVRAVIDVSRLARSRAIAQDRDVRVDLAYDRFSVDGGHALPLPPGEALRPGRVVFFADGGARGGPILLLAMGGRYGIDVNWLTGQVSGVQITAH
ncbi:MAG TPA: type II secretion system protein [Rhodopila sp.]|uniref:pilus assembly FimT family protein n=1 Tax=Rhodopila sp. TaxID=2480087 RepID=UPI002C7C6FE0|nr:type II secretion system protein [Rhodopila sp.]HVY15975.1 type II secretion system protein [Rhodopila sp.]